MLWYKSWLETRSRFLVGLVLLCASACALVLGYPQVSKLLPMAGSVDTSGEIGRRIKEAAELQSTYRGYIWSQWFGQNLRQMWTLFAVILGSGGLRSQSSGGAALFTLSLPASRRQIIGVRAAIGLAELFALALVPSLVIPLLSPAVSESYGLGAVLVYSSCLFIAGSVFFSLTSFLSTVFDDVWRPALVACLMVFVLGLFEEVAGAASFYGVFRAMSGGDYFFTGALPWLAVPLLAAVSAGFLHAAAVNIERHDF
jgi:hypothetical protein